MGMGGENEKSLIKSLDGRDQKGTKFSKTKKVSKLTDIKTAQPTNNHHKTLNSLMNIIYTQFL